MVLRKFYDKKDGLIISIYFILYGIIRFFIESLRMDSLMLFNVKVAQLVSIIMMIIGIIIFMKIVRCKDDKQKVGYSIK